MRKAELKMQEFIKRMYTERDDLKGKIKKAKNAIDNPPYGSDSEGLRMLAEQVKAMENYLYWLSERIEYEEKK